MTAKIFYEVSKSWQFSEKVFTEAATGDVLFLYSKRDSNTGVFQWSLQNVKEHLFWIHFEEHLQTTASVFSREVE